MAPLDFTGMPLAWKDSKQYLKHVRTHGIAQFISTYDRIKGISNDKLYWGDEVEYGVFETSGEGPSRTVRIAMHKGLLPLLREREAAVGATGRNGCSWHEEYGSWMLESTPEAPYSGFVRDLVEVECNMRLRRARILAALGPNQIAPTVTNFPTFGTADFTMPALPPGGEFADSSSVPDACINSHPRFGALTQNIRGRRGEHVRIQVPLYRDVNTPEFASTTTEGSTSPQQPSSSSSSSSSTSSSEASEGGPTSMVNTVLHKLQGYERGYLASWPESWPVTEGDCMAYGMGCCCLQVTFQSRDVHESRLLYDQLAVLAPIMMALTAGTPFFHGRVLDTDARWSIISQSVDDRTAAERCVDGSEPNGARDRLMAGEGVRPLSKSRYDSISCFLSADTPAHFNDVPCELDEVLHAELLANGMDPALARHVAHLFVRDPLVIFDKRLNLDDARDTDHWENLQSTNWQTMRWKPPPPQNECAPRIGWRTEFRSMEVQLTDFENAAFTVFIVLITRVFLVFDLDLRLPISFIDANMHRAHMRQAASTQQFYFRNCFEPVSCDSCSNKEVEEMTMEEIVNGKGDYFTGLIPLIYAYLEHINCDEQEFQRIDAYLSFIADRAAGKVQTNATWMRDFVEKHEDYKKDSVVTPAIAHDLMLACDQIGRGELKPAMLYRPSVAKVLQQVGPDQAYGSPLASEKLSKNCREQLIRSLVESGMRRRATSIGSVEEA